MVVCIILYQLQPSVLVYANVYGWLKPTVLTYVYQCVLASAYSANICQPTVLMYIDVYWLQSTVLGAPLCMDGFAYSANVWQFVLGSAFSAGLIDND